MKKITVKFIEPHAPYSKGDVATFSEDKAERLLKSKIAAKAKAPERQTTTLRADRPTTTEELAPAAAAALEEIRKIAEAMKIDAELLANEAERTGEAADAAEVAQRKAEAAAAKVEAALAELKKAKAEKA